MTIRPYMYVDMHMNECVHGGTVMLLVGIHTCMSVVYIYMMYIYIYIYIIHMPVCLYVYASMNVRFLDTSGLLRCASHHLLASMARPTEPSQLSQRYSRKDAAQQTHLGSVLPPKNLAHRGYDQGYFGVCPNLWTLASRRSEPLQTRLRQVRQGCTLHCSRLVPLRS